MEEITELLYQAETLLKAQRFSTGSSQERYELFQNAFTEVSNVRLKLMGVL